MRALFVLPLLFACADPVGSDRTSGFDGDADGWTIVGDAQASSATPDHAAEGGNPGGLICADDDVAGGVWYFQAPAKFLGDQSGSGTLSFDLKSTELTNAFDDIDVVIEGPGSVRLVHDLAANPGTTWTHYDVPLEASAWKAGGLDGAAATAEQLQEVLAAIKALRIRGEYNTGPDTGCLDNVELD